MPFILDMVHHNPGEAPFESAFLDPAHLADRGFNGQVFKHLNCAATFSSTGIEVFPTGSPDRVWLDTFTTERECEIAAAKAQELTVFYHLDLFVLPKRLVEHFRDEICDPESGRILLDRPRTLELHRILFDELCARFPQVDGFIIRFGETYLFDTPYHTGNGPLPKCGGWDPLYGYTEAIAGGKAVSPWTAEHSAACTTLVSFLRNEVCERHGKYLVFRTWDTAPDRLHAVPENYLAVTDPIPPHPKLLFSIKHTALDFWRRVKVNECIGIGRHPQIIEVQCQREYEGKGAFPNYIMHGVIDGFPENTKPIGLTELTQSPLFQGIYSWSRGGGWYGPYLKNELWCDLNASVLAAWMRNPQRGEEAIFLDHVCTHYGLVIGDAASFRQLCLLSAEAVLKGRHCEAFDRILGEAILPTALWMRDDRLGGRDQLAPVLDFLGTQGLFDEALAEKDAAVAIWQEIQQLGGSISWPDETSRTQVHTSVDYGLRLFDWIRHGWHVMAYGWQLDHGIDSIKPTLEKAITACEKARALYMELAENPACASLYQGRYFSLPGQPDVPGIDATLALYLTNHE
ncbi:MAG: hypothetical protein ABI600_08700 [Luteolibacter sp.]